MKKSIFYILCASSLSLVSATAWAETQNNGNLTLVDALAQVLNQPELQAARAHVAAGKEQAIGAHKAAYYPRVEVSAFAARVQRVAEVTIPLPDFLGGPQTSVLGDKERYGYELQVTQPLFNRENQAFRAPAAAAQVEAAGYETEQRARELIVDTVHAYGLVLGLAAQRAAVAAQFEAVTAHKTQVQNFVRAGRAIPNDVLQIEFNLSEINIEQIKIKEQEGVARANLARLLGENELKQNLTPIDSLRLPPSLPEVNEAILEKAFAARPDFQALNRQVYAAELNQNAAKANGLPSFGLQFKHAYNHGIPSEPTHQNSIGIGMTWVPFASGTQKNQRNAAAFEVESLQAQAQAAKLGVNVNLEKARADFMAALALGDSAQMGIRAAQENIRVQTARFEAGRAKVTDVLDAEAQLARQVASVKIARLRHLDAWVDWILHTGGSFQIAMAYVNRQVDSFE